MYVSFVRHHEMKYIFGIRHYGSFCCRFHLILFSLFAVFIGYLS